MSAVLHTPTPWKQRVVNGVPQTQIDSVNDVAIAYVYWDEDGTWKADVAHIVQCVNNFDALVGLLRETLQPGAYGIGSTLAERIDAALSKATSQPPTT